MENSNNNSKHAKSVDAKTGPPCPKTMADLRHAKSLPMHAKSLSEISLVREPINSERRKFLKVLLIGGGGFLLGRLFGPIAKLFSNRGFNVNPKGIPTSDTLGPIVGTEPQPKAGKETDFENFKVIEKKDSMTFIDKKANEEILILDWSDEDR